MTTMYIATCGGFEVADPNPSRAQERAIAELCAECGGNVAFGSWAWEAIQACRARQPRVASEEEVRRSERSAWSAWATNVIGRD